jgi:hypothetical protein
VTVHTPEAPEHIAPLVGAPAGGARRISLRSRLRLAFSASLGCAFVGLFILAGSDFVTQNSSAEQHWYYLSLSLEGFLDVVSMIAIAFAGVFFLEPLIEHVREMAGLGGVVHHSEALDEKRVRRWMLKLMVGFVLIVVSMSHEMVHGYVLEDLLKQHGLAVFKMVTPIAIVFGTTLVWTYGVRQGRAWLMGCAASLLLASVAFGTYVSLEQTFVDQQKTADQHAATHKPVSHAVATGERGPPLGITAEKSGLDADEPTIHEGGTLESSGQPAPPPAPAPPKPAASAADPLAATMLSRISAPFEQMRQQVGEFGKKAFDRVARLTSSLRRQVLFAIAAWLPVGLFGGLILDRPWGLASRSAVLAAGIIALTALGDAVAQIARSYSGSGDFSKAEFYFYIALGAGWAAGIFILGRSADLIFGERK